MWGLRDAQRRKFDVFEMGCLKSMWIGMNREQCVAIGESRSEPTTLQYGVPQGSVLGPVLFTVYTGTLAFLLEAHGVSYHFFADYTRLYIRVEDIDEAKHRLSSLLSDLKTWMTRRKLKLNDGKTRITVIEKP